MSPDQRGFFQALIGNGRPLLTFTGLCLVLSGGFALFISAMGQFLPHDIEFLGMTADELCAINECRVVHFMFHDRVAFGGTLIAIGFLYIWLAEFPLRHRQAWSWWLFVISGISGFGSFLTYFGYGYLDSWHGIGTLLLLPCFLIGLFRSFSTLQKPRHIWSLFQPAVKVPWMSPFGVGRALLLATAAGMFCGGFTIMVVGMTEVFVPQDLIFMNLKADALNAINARLIPLIAHDRAGFGGAICSTGIVIFFCVWCAIPSRSLWQVFCLSGTFGFGTAIGVHPIVGYNDFGHLAPAILGLLIFIVGSLLCLKPMYMSTENNTSVSHS
jgi:hypothetical protein